MRNESDVKFVMSVIVALTSNTTGVSVAAILSGLREARSVRARWIVMHIASKRYGLSLNQIGRYLGDRHHTTVLHGLREAERMSKDVSFMRAIGDVYVKLNGSQALQRVAA